MANKITCSHILVKTKKDAEDVIKRLEKGGSFSKIAKEESKCPSGKHGGNLGEFGRGRMVKSFEKAAFGLDKGGISKPVKSEFGWHVIKRTK